MGSSIKDSRKEGRVFGQMRTHADRGAVKDLAEFCMLVLFLFFQYVLQTLSMGDA